MSIDNIENKKKNTFIQNWFRFERNEIFLMLSFFFYGIAFANYEAFAPVWLRNLFDVNLYVLIGLVTVIPSFVGVIGTTVWGIFADKFGTKKFVLIGLAGFAAMFFTLIFTTSEIYFLVTILIGYLFGTAHTANNYALATRTINKPKEITLAKMTMMISFSWMIFVPLAGYISDKFVHAKTIQLIIAVVAILIAFMLAIFVKEEKVTEETLEVTEEQNSQKKKVALTLIPFLFTGLMILVFMFQSAAGFWAFASTYFTETLDVSWKTYSILLIIKTGLAIPLTFSLSRIKTTKQKSWVSIIFIAWICFSYLMMMLFPNNWMLLFALYSVPMYPLYNVVFYSLVASFTNKEKRATAYGLFNSIGTLGYIVGILLLGLIADISAIGIKIMFLVSLILAGVTLIISILIFVIRTRKEIIIPIKEKEEGIEVQS